MVFLPVRHVPWKNWSSSVVTETVFLLILLPISAFSLNKCDPLLWSPQPGRAIPPAIKSPDWNLGLKSHKKPEDLLKNKILEASSISETGTAMAMVEWVKIVLPFLSYKFVQGIETSLQASVNQGFLTISIFWELYFFQDEYKSFSQYKQISVKCHVQMNYNDQWQNTRQEKSLERKIHIMNWFQACVLELGGQVGNRKVNLFFMME